jgi:hypothetical protein
MTEKIYDIAFDSDGWCCRSGGQLLGTFPSWLLAIGATKAAAEKDKHAGITPVIRCQDLRGGLHKLDMEAQITNQHPSLYDQQISNSVDSLAASQRPH